MVQTNDIKVNLAEFLQENLSFYTTEWIQYLEQHKSYLISLLKEASELEILQQDGNPLMASVADNIIEIQYDKITKVAKDIGIAHAKVEAPLHLIWELFLSSREFIWNAIKSFYLESNHTLSIEESFALERYINDIIDFFIRSSTTHYINYKEELLNSHRETVDELSVPIIPITDKVCILPIVGTVDTFRAKKIRERTLTRVKELKVQQLIIDISGVPFVDTAVISHLFKIIQGIKLLGCSTILTGIGPEIADTMIELGIDIDSKLKTKADLQQALQSIRG